MTTQPRPRQRTDVSPLGRRAVLGLLGAAAVGGLAGPAAANPETGTRPVEVALYSVVNGDGRLPLEVDFTPETLLYDRYEFPAMVPVTGPDGDQLTWGEFSDVGGSVRLRCSEGRTAVRIDATGLLPEGLYTAWVTVLFDDLVTLVGMAPLGPNDGSESVVRASRSGRATVVGLDTPGPLTHAVHPEYAEFETPDCLLDLPSGDDFPDGLLVEVALTYHYDDTVRCSGSRSDAVEQTSALFGPLSLVSNQAGQSIDSATPR